MPCRCSDGERILTLARKKGLRVGAAPDTFLGAGIQTCVRLIDEGAIGMPVAATAFFANHGPEAWHPDPEFFYAQGGGPVFDWDPTTSPPSSRCWDPRTASRARCGGASRTG